jgi:hypothetical protein
MTLTVVRRTIADFFGGQPTTTTDAAGQTWDVYRTPVIPGVATFFLAEVSQDDQNDYFQGLPAGTRLGLKASIKLVQKTSARIAMGGDHDGIRGNVYRITICFYGLTSSAYGDAAQLDFEAVLDAVEAHVYSDRSLGTLNRTDGYLIDAGEGAAGLTIRPEAVSSMTANGQLWLYAEVTFNVREWIHG